MKSSNNSSKRSRMEDVLNYLQNMAFEFIPKNRHSAASALSQLIDDRRKIVEKKLQIRKSVWEEVTANEMRAARSRRSVPLSKKTEVLFSEVLPVLCKTKALQLQDVFQCRLVCKKWKKGFDECLRQANKIEPGRCSTWDDLTRNALPFPTSKHDDIALLTMDQNPFLVSRFLKMNKIPFQDGNPSAQILTWSKEIHGLFIDLSDAYPAKGFDFDYLLDRTPNLEELAIDGRIAFYCRPIRSKRITLRALAVSYLHHILFLELLCDQRDTLETFIKVGKRDLIVGEDSIATIFAGPYPKLKTFVLLECPEGCRDPVAFERFRNHMPSLEEFHWQYIRCSSKDILDSFKWVNMIGGNLRHLYLTFLNPEGSMVKFGKKERASLWLWLRHLETLELTVQRIIVKNIDFLLPLESLKEFTLTFRKTVDLATFLNIKKTSSSSSAAAVGGTAHAYATEEIIRYKGYEKRMYESNVWDIFPELRRLQIAVDYICGQTPFEKKVSQVYTRDGFKKFLKEKEAKGSVEGGHVAGSAAPAPKED